MFPPMNASRYFDEIYNEQHIELFLLLTTCFSPFALFINFYGIYAILFHSAPHLKILWKHLLFHQATLISTDFIIFDLGKPVMLFPVAAGFSTNFLRHTLSAEISHLVMCMVIALWSLTFSSALQILLFKHHNLWPPGSRWTLSTRHRFLLCVYLNALAAFSFSVPLYLSGLNNVENKEKLKREVGLEFLSVILDQPRIGTVDQDGIAFFVFAIASVHILVVFAAALTIVSISTFYGLRKQRAQISQKTYRMQKKYLSTLLIQLTAPLWFAFAPAAGLVSVIVTRTWVPIAYNLVLISLAGMHGVVATLCSIFLNECYRKPFLGVVLFPRTLLRMMSKEKRNAIGRPEPRHDPQRRASRNVVGLH